MLGHAAMVNDVDPTQINGRHGVNVRRGSLMVSNIACHARRRRFAPRTGDMTLLGYKPGSLH